MLVFFRQSRIKNLYINILNQLQLIRRSQNWQVICTNNNQMTPTISTSLKAKRVMSAQMSKAHTITPSYELINQSINHIFNFKGYLDVLNEEPKITFNVSEGNPALKAYQRFHASSNLRNKHELLIQQLQSTEQETVNHLNLNFFGVDHLGKNELLYLKDPQITHTLFQCLWELDQEVISKLFPDDVKEKYSLKLDQIGKPLKTHSTPMERFRLDYLKKTINILSEPFTQIVRKMSIFDKQLGLFIESLWKFLIILFDVNYQWSADRCRTFVKEEVDRFAYEMEQLKTQNNFLSENLISKVKGNQLRMAVEQKKSQSLKEKYKILQSEMAELKMHYDELGSLENANGVMLVMGTKIKDLDITIKQLDRSLNDRKTEMSKSLKNVAQIFRKINSDQKSIPGRIKEEFRIRSWIKEEDNQHPLVAMQIKNLLAPEQELVISEQSLCNFFEFLQINFKESKQMTASQMLMNQGGYKSIINILRQMQEKGDSPFLKLFSMLFGINGFDALSLQCLGQILSQSKLTKISIENTTRKSVSFNVNEEGSQFLKLSESMKCCSQSELEVLQKQNIEDVESMKLVDYLLIVVEEIKEQDKNSWIERSVRWKEQLLEVGMAKEWICGLGDFLDERLVEQYFLLKYCVEFKKEIVSISDHEILLKDEEYRFRLRKFFDETFSSLKQVYLETPRLLGKIVDAGVSAEDTMNSQRDSKPKIMLAKRRQSIRMGEQLKVPKKQ